MHVIALSSIEGAAHRGVVAVTGFWQGGRALFHLARLGLCRWCIPPQWQGRLVVEIQPAYPVDQLLEAGLYIACAIEV